MNELSTLGVPFYEQETKLSALRDTDVSLDVIHLIIVLKIIEKMTPPLNSHHVSSSESLSDSAPLVHNPNEDETASPAHNEGSMSLDKEAEASTEASSTKLLIAAQVLEQEAKKLQSLVPNSAMENLDHHPNLAIGLLEEVQKELKQRNTTSQQDKTDSVIEYYLNYSFLFLNLCILTSIQRQTRQSH